MSFTEKIAKFQIPSGKMQLRDPERFGIFKAGVTS